MVAGEGAAAWGEVVIEMDGGSEEDGRKFERISREVSERCEVPRGR